MTPLRIELLWLEGCPSHETAETMLRRVLEEAGVEAAIERIQVESEDAGIAVCFPGSPTIRVNGQDVEPGWQPCDDCTPRCRVYSTALGLQPLPERRWIYDAVRSASGRDVNVPDQLLHDVVVRVGSSGPGLCRA